MILTALLAAACSPPAPSSAPPATEVAAALDVASVEAPIADARVTSPLAVTGLAPGNWYFENQFPVRLVGADGAVLAEAPAHPRVSWTDPGDKVFDATLNFSVTADTPATLVLQEDMPGEGETPRETRIELVLTP
ncbi:hypothetical protein U91I_02277 [alpha proteobacterium U9-1i]|nr:hypothetical protein U91I_02277 [alpha proteobacterium U9-1i]